MLAQLATLRSKVGSTESYPTTERRVLVDSSVLPLDGLADHSVLEHPRAGTDVDSVWLKKSHITLTRGSH